MLGSRLAVLGVVAVVSSTAWASHGTFEPQAARPRYVAQTRAREVTPEGEKTVSIFGNTNLKLATVLDQLARNQGLRLVMQSDIDANREINLPTLKDVPLSDALRAILHPLGYSARVDNDELYIFARELRTFVIQLPMVGQTWSSNVSNESGGQGNGGANLGARISVTSEANSTQVWTEIESALKTVIGEGGTYSISRTTGFVTVTGSPAALDAVATYIESLNREMERQGVIEVRIAEVTFDRSREVGVDWSAVLTSLPGVNFGGIAVSASQALTATQPGAFAFSISGASGSAVLRALETQGEVSVVSQPNMLVSNNLPSAIQVGTIQTYVSSIMTTLASNVGASTNVQTGVLSSGLTMSVVPRIFADGSVTLALSTVLQDVPEIGEIEFSGGSVQLPKFVRRSYSGVVHATPGDTLVIAGLLEGAERKRTTGIPWLSRVPIIGPLAGFDTESETRSELVILLTPRVPKTVTPPPIPSLMENNGDGSPPR